VPRYREKTKSFNAIQYTGQNFDEVKQVASQSGTEIKQNWDLSLSIITTGRSIRVHINDWIIEDPYTFSLYPCPPFVFIKRYEEIT
jgi:hypothetical protein